MKIRLPQVKNFLPTAHLEIMRGTSKEASDYCKKGEQSHDEWKQFKHRGSNFGKNADVTEFGELPEDKDEMNTRLWAEFVELSEQGNFEEIKRRMPSKYTQYYSTMKRIYSDFSKKLDNIPKRCGSWYWSHTPNCGKSEAARENDPESTYIKSCNINWDGYSNEDTVVIDDLDKSHEFMGHNLKIWGDKYPFKAKVLYSTMNIRPKRIICTSNYRIEEIFRCSIQADAIRSRYPEKEFIFDPLYGLTEDERQNRLEQIADDSFIYLYE